MAEKSVFGSFVVFVVPYRTRMKMQCIKLSSICQQLQMFHSFRIQEEVGRRRQCLPSSEERCENALNISRDVNCPAPPSPPLQEFHKQQQDVVHESMTNSWRLKNGRIRLSYSISSRLDFSRHVNFNSREEDKEH